MASYLVKKLVDMTFDELVLIQTKDDCVSPIHLTAMKGNTEAAKMLVGRRPNLVYKRSREGLLPIHFAVESGHRETLAYFILNTPNHDDDDDYIDVYSGQSGLKLLLYTIDAGLYDVAMDLAKKYPYLAILRDHGNPRGLSALQRIAGKVSVHSGKRDLNLWKRFIYSLVVFAAAITVPGGNKQELGLPFFSGETAFLVFAISDAISFFASILSLLMFLAIITSRFAEEDFLYALPNRLIICLLSVYTSILFMMVAFGATLYIVFGKKHRLIIIPVCLLSCFPIASLAYLQASLLFDVISHTYGAGNLGKRIKRLKIGEMDPLP
ncbi:hypothetical protein ACS0TY_034001 [Phlomoides rotata]